VKKCVIIGSGFAGLSAAVYLSKAGYKVIILESSPKPGGRAYSFKDSKSGDIVDNGQHILMGCYKYTLNFFNEIEADKNLLFQENLKIIFLKENFKTFPLSCPNFLYPFNLLFALMNYKAISSEEKIQFLSFFIKLFLSSGRELEKFTVYEWLKKENQSENAQKAFWEILAVGALNTNTKRASAKIFADILKEIFFKGNKASTIIIPKLDLSRTYCDQSINFIKNRKGEIYFGENVLKLEDENSKIVKIITSKREITDFDFVISSVPNFAYKKIIKSEKLNCAFEPEYSPIISVHIWLNENLLKEKFYGLINSSVQWIFNHEKYITLVISNAGSLIEKCNEEIFKYVTEELEKFILLNPKAISSYKIIKEKKATFVPSQNIIKQRPSSATKFKNFFLAGDWTNTGLPSTIESAVKSGKIASDLIIDSK
jgi:squalene-associated FAD-dependent desaturase